MIMNSLMFNTGTLNIFTDASIRKMPDNETIGCAGANIIVGPDANSIIEQDTRIIRGSTSNNSEIHAVKLGIEKALKYREQGFKAINLISDSKLCIYGLREWVFKWIVDSVGKQSLIGSTNQEVANQDVILQIIYMILDNELSINFYHQNGHVHTNNMKEVLKAKQTFISSNFLTHDIDLELIKNISIANNAIDSLTRCILNNNTFEKIFPHSMMKYIYIPFDKDKYAKLINVRR